MVSFFNMGTDVNAFDCTRWLYEHRMKVCGTEKKIPLRSGKPLLSFPCYLFIFMYFLFEKLIIVLTCLLQFQCHKVL